MQGEIENMKTTIYELLGMIKDGKAPKKIMFEGKKWDYMSSTDGEFIDYEVEGRGWCLFTDELSNHYGLYAYLNDEVEILDEPKEDKIEKLEDSYDLFEPNSGIDTSWTINEQILKNKINELIDEVNKLI